MTQTLLYFYINTGNSQVPQYKPVTTRFQDLRFQNWFYFADIDNDGDIDLLQEDLFSLFHILKIQVMHFRRSMFWRSRSSAHQEIL
ncbi:MAG: hypothetical protein IPM38_12210 [Ignavibacteria bacterium]|nr:hypothetical protein [Ignavibacteria bacterium]